jgi:hypothetical protein
MIKISYFTTIKNELAEIQKLLPFIQKYKKPDDEIVILMDIPHNIEVENFLKTQDIQLCEHPLNDDFAQFKNYGTSKCKNDYIFNLDADEMPPNYLLENISDIIEQNNYPELIYVPRINKIIGCNDNNLHKFGEIYKWNINDKNWINFPDYQSRIWKNDKRIFWKSKVHETLVGNKSFIRLPILPEVIDHVSFLHVKDISKQIKQNNKYRKIINIEVKESLKDGKVTDLRTSVDARKLIIDSVKFDFLHLYMKFGKSEDEAEKYIVDMVSKRIDTESERIMYENLLEFYDQVENLLINELFD